MRVLVTGATGFIGYEVARLLAETGTEVRALVRRLARGALLNPFDVEQVVGDLSAPDSLRRACTGVDVVVHLAARATFEPAQVLRPTMVGGSVALLEAAAEAGARAFVHGSSLMVYGDVARGEIDADTPVAPHVDYGRVKVETERHLRALAQRRGVALGVVRLPHVYGARDLMFGRLRGRLTVLPGLSADAYAHLHVRDAARALVAASEQGWTGTAPVGDDENASWDTFFATLRRYYPHHRVVRVPAALAEVGAGLAEPLMRLRRGPQLVTRDTVRSSDVRQPVRRGTLWSELGIAPRYPTVEDGIPAALDELVAYRWRHSVDDRSS